MGVERPKLDRKTVRRIKERDGNHCVVCWRKYFLQVHHFHDRSGTIPSKPQLAILTYNFPYIETRDCDLVTLCAWCHGKVATCDERSPLYQLVLNYLAQFCEAN